VERYTLINTVLVLFSTVAVMHTVHLM